MTEQKTFKGYAIKDPKEWTEFNIVEFQSKAWEETDVEVAITHCGVCGSDVHTIASDWGGYKTPLVVGHEIVGKAVRVGSKVKGIKVGDRVGVGAHINSCHECHLCKSDNENYCPKMVNTYNDTYQDGVRTMGGYSTGIIANEQFVYSIPDAITSEDAATMFCAGLTVFAPLSHSNIGPGKKVGVIGIGGLGHYAIMFGKALGAEVTAISHSASKAEDARKLGADNFIVTGDKDFHQGFQHNFDLIISTRSQSTDFSFEIFFSMLAPFGKFVTLGVPDKPLPPFDVGQFIVNACFFGASHTGSKADVEKMLALVAEKGIKPWVEVLPMREIKKAVEGVWNGKARYRYVLTQDIEP